MLGYDKDMEAYVNFKRVISLMLKVVLTKPQQLAVPFFRKYVLSDDKIRTKLDKVASQSQS